MPPISHSEIHPGNIRYEGHGIWWNMTRLCTHWRNKLMASNLRDRVLYRPVTSDSESNSICWGAPDHQCHTLDHEACSYRVHWCPLKQQPELWCNFDATYRYVIYRSLWAIYFPLSVKCIIDEYSSWINSLFYDIRADIKQWILL
jgi:hypothetical protein